MLFSGRMEELVKQVGFLMLAVLVLGFSGPLHAQEGVQESAQGRQRLVANSLSGSLLEVHFLDVGQGDAIYIRTPGEKHYLVDTGTRGARRKIIPYLKYLKVEKLSGVLITHSHLDHAGSLYYLADAFPIETIYSSGYFHGGSHNKKTLARLKEKKIPMKVLRGGDVLEWEKDVKVNVYHPPKDWSGNMEDPNNMSVVVRLSYKDIDFLLTGDAEKHSEKEILKHKYELKSEFLKVGHHGSETSSYATFLDTVQPLFAVISCGEGNKFKHPHQDTLDKLRARDVTILRTDQNGTIGVYTDGKRLMIKIKGKDWQPVSILFRLLRPGDRALFVMKKGGVYVC